MMIRIVEWRELDGKWAKDHWKMQISYNNGETWTDVPVIRLPDVTLKNGESRQEN